MDNDEDGDVAGDFDDLDKASQWVPSPTFHRILQSWTDPVLRRGLRVVLNNTYEQLQPFKSQWKTWRGTASLHSRRSRASSDISHTGGDRVFSLQLDNDGFFFDSLGHHQVILDSAGNNLSKVRSVAVPTV